ncbi:hypothetical protein JXJ21_10105 [candidate division KSB1 bacterium]|nr:hypothetical protein [candidate division KSB1 bacterium]
MRLAAQFVFLLCILLLLACAAQTNLQPLGKSNLSANMSLGGPIVSAFGTRIPIPYATVGTNYGLTDQINMNANLHLMSLGYRIFGADIGASWFPVLNQGAMPVIGIQPRLLLFSSLKKDVDSRFRGYPLITNTYGWQLGSGLIYSGFDLTIPLTLTDYDDEAASTIISPFAGYRWQLGQRTGLLTEVKWHGANMRSTQLAVEYLPIANYGAITTLISIERRF